MELDVRLESLFDVPVAVCSVEGRSPLLPLRAWERERVGPRWSPKRLWEYQAGRHCAKLALEQLGVEASSFAMGIPSSNQGAPCWPPGVAGSITHSARGVRRIAACVVSKRLQSLGIDAEEDHPLDSDLCDRILTPAELAFARKALSTPSEIGRHALRVFSAKESFYKCQFPVTHRFLGFQEVETEFDLRSEAFEVSCALTAEELEKPRLTGSFTYCEGLLVTAVALPSRRLNTLSVSS